METKRDKFVRIVENRTNKIIDMLGIKDEYIAVGGNSSLQLMYDTLSRALLFGVLGGNGPWVKEEKRK